VAHRRGVTRYRLKLKRLDFVSAVDDPAQETAKVLLIKRRQVDGVAHVAKVADELGLVFCWAFTSKAAGEDYFDLHGDTIDQDFIKAAAEFMEHGGAVDEMHDGETTGRVVFAMPMTPDVAKAFGIETDTVGLMVALRPSAEALAKFKSGEYTGVSIAGIGEREQVSSKSTRPAQPRKVAPMADEEQKTPDLAERMDALEKLVAGIAEKLAAKAEDEKPAELKPDEEAAKSADPVVFKCADGTEIRKSAGDVAVAMAKRADAAEKVAKSERDARELVELTKRAGETIPHLGGAMDVKVQLLKAAEAIGPAAVEMLKGADAAFAGATVAKGANDGSSPKDATPQGELDAQVAKVATEQKISKAAATSIVLKTEQGRKLYAEAEHARQIANLNLTPTAPQA
jgi:hypothetical protein